MRAPSVAVLIGKATLASDTSGLPPTTDERADRAAANDRCKAFVEGSTCNYTCGPEDKVVHPVLFRTEAHDVNEVSEKDIRQNRLDDCYLMATLVSLAQSSEGRALIKNAVSENKNEKGEVVSYTVTLYKPEEHYWGLGATRFTQVPVTVATQFVCGHAQARTEDNVSEVWSPVIESAFLQYKDRDYGMCSGDAERGGTPSTAMQLLTGREAKQVGLSSTPARPTLADADGQVFQALLDITLPPVKETVRWEPRFVGITEPWLLELGILQYRVGGGRRDLVTVVEEKTVAGLDATVLLASDTSALANWLTVRGFDLRPALKQWLGIYVAKGWHIVALRYDKADSRDTIASRALRITFPAEQPIYPYLEPADAAETQGRGLDLFVVAEGRVEGVLTDERSTPWDARPTFAAPAALTNKLTAALPGVELPANAWVTEFVDYATKRAESDVTFHASESPVELRKPPAIARKVNFYPVPYELPFVLAPLAWWWWRVGARRRAITRRG